MRMAEIRDVDVQAHAALGAQGDQGGCAHGVHDGGCRMEGGVGRQAQQRLGSSG